ncbi:hypothetical protein HYE15_03730 [Mycoplasmopsis bovis]|nr:hypothetical protein [Mycoplasmopsis bovis]QQH25457.1 hypothetical protein HYE15_03730 [Mycoplasmopsis bovis]
MVKPKKKKRKTWSWSKTKSLRPWNILKIYVNSGEWFRKSTSCDETEIKATNEKIEAADTKTAMWITKVSGDTKTHRNIKYKTPDLSKKSVNMYILPKDYPERMKLPYKFEYWSKIRWSKTKAWWKHIKIYYWSNDLGRSTSCWTR